MSPVDSGMSPLAVLVLLQVTAAVFGVKHSLTYTYTAFAHKPVGLPGIHEFTAMGHLDTHMIDYFDSDQQLKVPRQPWMGERLDKDYWVKGTQSRQSKQQWFKVNIGILMERLGQNKTSGQHVLQWQHGCEGEMQPGGTLKFSTGVDMYSYDGYDFLSFDNSNSAWVAGARAAEQTKRTWDGVDVLKEYTKGYLEKECMEWMGKFLTYQERVSKNAKKPEVYLFASKAKKEAHVILTCMATGFYPKDIQLWIKRNGRVLRREDGVMSSGLRPNGDETFQRRDWVEILKTDQSQYTCEVIHKATQVNIEKEWDHKLPENGSIIGVAVGVVVLVLVLAVVAGVLIFCYRKGRICQPTSEKKGSNDPIIPIVCTSGSSSGGSSSGSSNSASTISSSNTGSISKIPEAVSFLASNADPAESQEAEPLNPPATDAD